MAKKSQAPPQATSVTAERAARLYQLLTILGKGAQTRAALTKRLKLGLRGFYRDLELLREVGIIVDLTEGRYTLRGKATDAIAQLPFPDPNLTLGEARDLAKGRSKAHKKLKEQIARIEK
jgi:hypothetical protein